MINQVNQAKKNAVQAFDAAHDLMSVSLENIQKLTSLQLEMSKVALEQTSNAIKNLSTVSNPQEFFAQANTLATSTIERNIENYRTIYEVMTAAQFKVGKVVESQVQAVKFSAPAMPSWINKFQGSKFDASSAMNEFMNKANLAMNNATKLANEARVITGNNMLSASETMQSVVKTAQKAATESVVIAKKAAAETIATTKKVAAETVVTAKKAATETVATVISSAKKASENVVEAAKKSADAVVANVNATANTVAASVKKPAVKTVRTAKVAK